MPHSPIHGHMNTLKSSLGFSILPKDTKACRLFGSDISQGHYHSAGSCHGIRDHYINLCDCFNINSNAKNACITKKLLSAARLTQGITTASSATCLIWKFYTRLNGSQSKCVKKTAALYTKLKIVLKLK